MSQQQPASERITVAELLAACGSADHESGDATLRDIHDALGEAHPAVAGDLVNTLRRAIDQSDGRDRGTASGSEHPDWHESLRRAAANSNEEGYDD